MYSVEVTNLKQIRKMFQKYPKVVSSELEKATKGAGAVILENEKREAPVGSGALRRSIGLKYSPIAVTIFPNKKYAIYIHEGTGIYGKYQRPIFPKRAKALRWKDKGQVRFAKSIKGQKPNPFVDRAAKKSVRKVNNIFNETLNNILKRI